MQGGQKFNLTNTAGTVCYMSQNSWFLPWQLAFGKMQEACVPMPAEGTCSTRSHACHQNFCIRGGSPAGPEARPPAPNSDGDSLLNHRAHQPEDQRRNRKQGTKCPSHKHKNQHLDL